MEDNNMKNYTITVNGTPYNVTVEEGAGAPVAAAPVAAPAAAPAVEEKIDFSNVKIEPIFKDMWILRPSPSPITAP